MFGLAQVDDYKLKFINIKEFLDAKKEQEYNNELTETFGFSLSAVYHFATITVLLNMLIANLSQSFEKIIVIIQCFVFFFS